MLNSFEHFSNSFYGHDKTDMDSWNSARGNLSPSGSFPPPFSELADSLTFCLSLYNLLKLRPLETGFEKNFKKPFF